MRGHKGKARPEIRKSSEIAEIMGLRKIPYVEQENREGNINSYYRKYFDGKVRHGKLGTDSVFSIDGSEEVFSSQSTRRNVHGSVDLTMNSLVPK